MNKKNIFLILSVFAGNFLVSFGALAMEIKDYPTINGISLGKNPTLEQWTNYIFNLALLVGAIIAVIICIYAGLKFFLSKGSPAQIESSRRMMVRAIVGTALLFGAVVLLNTINTSITSSRIKEIKVGEGLDGIVITEKMPDGDQEIWTNQNYSKTDYQITKIRWLSKAEDLPSIFIYPSPNFEGKPTEIKNGSSTSIGQNQSFVLNWNRVGVYLYDDVDFKLKAKSAPLGVSGSIPALSNPNFDFDSQVASVRITNPEKPAGSQTAPDGYGAILFTKPDYQGQCAWITGSIKSLSEAHLLLVSTAQPVTPSAPSPNNPPTPPSGNGTSGLANVSSIYVFRIPADNGGPVVFYEETNCKESKRWDQKTKTEKDTFCVQNDYSSEKIFKDACKDVSIEYEKKGPVFASLKVNSNTLVILRNNKGECQVFKNQGSDTCINSIKYGNVYGYDYKIWPYSFTLLPGK